MATDAFLLLELSRCLDCLTLGQMGYIETDLLDLWASNEAGFTPAAVPEFVIDSFRWYDAGDFTGLADGAFITTSSPWVDRSPNHSNATTTLGNEPTFRANIFGSRPAVRLFGVNHLAFSSVITLTNFTILAVVKVGGDSIWMTRVGANRQVRAYRNNNNDLSLVFPGTQEVVSSSLSTPFSSAKMIGYRRVSGAGTIDFFENAAVIGASGGNNGALDLSQIGVIDGGNLNIDIGELVIYDSVVSNEDIAELYATYFKPKYGLP